MNKLIVLSALTSILVIGSYQPAWATGKDHANKDYRVFKKVVRVLDAVVNDGQRGGTRVIVKTAPYRSYHYHGPRRICYVSHGYPPRYARAKWGHPKHYRFYRR